jgi:hypothetical protein
MNRAQIRSRELVLMGLPVLALAAVALVLRNKSGQAKPALPLGANLVVESIKAEPLESAADVAEGFSDRVTVVLDHIHAGPPPSWWGANPATMTGDVNIDPTDAKAFWQYAKPGRWRVGGCLTFREGAVERKFVHGNLSPVGMRSPFWDAKLGRYILTFDLPLSRVPAKVGEVTFRGVVGANLDAVTPFSLVIRKAGEQPRLPDISLDSPFSLDRVAVNTSGGETEVDVVVKDQEQSVPPKATMRCWGSSLSIQAANGADYGSIGDGWDGISSAEPQYDKQLPGYHCRFQFNPAQIPRKAGKLTFHAKFSLNGAWPLAVTKVVRE